MKHVEKLRVLLVTRESLRKDRNEGNVLLNLFDGLPVELAHICCKPELPDNDVCQGRYFRITDKMVLQKLIHGLPMGETVGQESTKTEKEARDQNKRFYNFFHNHNWSLFYLLQDLAWKMSGLNSPALDAFVDAFKPDIVFAPLTPYWYANRLQGQVIRRADVPAVTYLYDDIYSLQQYSFSPFYWLHRFLVRSSIQKNLPLYRFAYTMTEQQKKEYEKLLHIPMKVLRKCAPDSHPEHCQHEGIRFIYAGGIYYGRDKTLAQVADAVRIFRARGYDVRLDVYTSSPLKKRMQKKLHDGAACFVHDAISAEELGRQYAQSDIALHVESFRKKDAYMTRLSFSTKIVDCLASGCAVLAICPAINAGWQYLRDEGAALCISDSAQIQNAVKQLFENHDLRKALKAEAMRCLTENHREIAIKKALFEEFATAI